jgi:tRNA pseudouridine32 synthase/23S rRNA pseudouridine746 synthase
MECVHLLKTDICPPERFTYPFAYEPHPLCQLAAQEVQAYIAGHEVIREDADKGKMFGVLVVSPTAAQEEGSKVTLQAPLPLGGDGGGLFLAAYSGLLAGRNDWPYFVPPVYDAQQPDGYFKTREREISALAKGNDDCQLSILNSQLAKQMSQELQQWLFHQYQLLNARGEVKDLVDIWQEYYSRPKLRQKFPLPPGGTGDCCAPKLLQYAYQHGLKPLCMAEFWWGATTKTELRQHLNYYPACRGKCKPILTWMLQGLDVDPDPETLGFERLELPVVYEDEWLLVVNKPSGLLSVPGRIEEYSVETIMQQRYPGAVIAHRLDMGTSGLLVVCKSLDVFRPLQEQFVRHEVRKKYIAVLEKQPSAMNNVEGTTADAHSSFLIPHSSFPAKGRISLPMRPDPMNRPRQVVDMEHGKRAVTNYVFIDDNTVALYPQTGRTHQLRIHCAHPDGLGRPIVGDELYGTRTAGQRLMLHAAELWFRHPVTGADMHFEVPFDSPTPLTIP